jgi:2,4-dienoyl-CoA reductase-like NADH-dependent reductase (Old Yellow Enzyme family)
VTSNYEGQIIMSQLFMPDRVGRYTLTNRLLMAPVIRSQAKLDGAPGDRTAEYYGQRAGVASSSPKGRSP